MTPDEVVSLAVKRTAYDTAKVGENIPIAQERFIRPWMEDEFYKDITAEVLAGSIGADNTLLLDGYVKKALAYFVLYVSFWETQIQETSTGNKLLEGEFSSQPSTSQLQLKRDNYLSMANMWLDAAEGYIKDQREVDSTKFPGFSVGAANTAQRNFSNVYIPE